MPVLSFKVDPLAAQRIRAKARAARTSVSAYLRQAALGGDARTPARVVRRKHPVSGLTHNAAGAGHPVTDEEIRAALADFP